MMMAPASQGRVTRADAARLLGLHRSSISRYLTEYPAFLGRDGKIDFELLVRHREASARTKESPLTAAHRRHSDSKARLAELAVQRAEIEVKELSRHFVSIEDLRREVPRAVAIVRDGVGPPDAALVAALVAEHDAARIGQLLRDWSRGMLEDCVRALSELEAGVAITTGRQSAAAPAASRSSTDQV